MASASAIGIKKDILLRSITELKNQLLGFAFTKSPSSDFSIYSGIAGIALSLFKSGFSAESRSIIHTRWRDAMHSIVNTQEKADLITGPIGFMFVACLVLCNSTSIDEEDKFKIALEISVHGINQLCKDSSRPCEFLYGAAGGLYCIRFLRCVPHNYANVASLLNDLESQLVSKIMREHQCGLGWPWYGKFYLGAAHGSAGILLQLLRTQLADRDAHIKEFV
eukprot:gene29266-38774_t